MKKICLLRDSKFQFLGILWTKKFQNCYHLNSWGLRFVFFTERPSQMGRGFCVVANGVKESLGVKPTHRFYNTTAVPKRTDFFYCLAYSSGIFTACPCSRTSLLRIPGVSLLFFYLRKISLGLLMLYSSIHKICWTML